MKQAVKTRFSILLITTVLMGCGAIAASNQRPYIDVKLVGVWQGEYLEEGGVLKRWSQIRHADGSYNIDFSFTGPDGDSRYFTESGRWWVEKGIFHEIALPDMKLPDKYGYSFKKKDCVTFDLIESGGLAEEAGSYTFSECLIADSPPASISNSI